MGLPLSHCPLTVRYLFVPSDLSFTPSNLTPSHPCFGSRKLPPWTIPSMGQRGSPALWLLVGWCQLEGLVEGEKGHNAYSPSPSLSLSLISLSPLPPSLLPPTPDPALAEIFYQRSWLPMGNPSLSNDHILSGFQGPLPPLAFYLSSWSWDTSPPVVESLHLLTPL